MKEEKKERENLKEGALSVYDIRRIVARLSEAHRGEASYTRERLRSDVYAALIGEGREPDDHLIEAAIGA